MQLERAGGLAPEVSVGHVVASRATMRAPVGGPAAPEAARSADKCCPALMQLPCSTCIHSPVLSDKKHTAEIICCDVSKQVVVGGGA